MRGETSGNKIAATPPGQRNAALNLGAYNVFQIVHGNPGLLDETMVRQRSLEGQGYP